MRQIDSRDLVVGEIGTDGVKLISISRGRRMINELVVGSEVELWVPYGPGWYRSSSVGELLVQEKRWNKAANFFFYNFGVKPKLIIRGSMEESWDDKRELIEGMGIINWIRFKFGGERMMWNEEVVERKLESVVLDEVIPRDFAETSILKSELRIGVYNASGEDGLAGWVSRRLQRSGYVVGSVETVDERVEGCQIRTSHNVEAIGAEMQNIKGIFEECQVVEVDSVAEGEVEIYFGESWAKMINYQSYSK